MIRTAALPPGLAAPAGVGLIVLGVAGAALALLSAGEAGGWLSHGVRPERWSTLAWIILFLASWTLMTGAMMLPSSLPFLQAVHRVGGAAASTAAGTAFSVMWLAVGVLQCLLLWAAGGMLARLAPEQAEQLAGASLLAAALYQVSPLAAACQRACAQPFAILARHWHGVGSQRRDALAAGLHYGLSCVGCCLPMIVVMFVVGVHDPAWIFGMALLMGLQKHATWGVLIARPAAVALTVAGVAIGGGWWVVPLPTFRALCGA